MLRDLIPGIAIVLCSAASVKPQTPQDTCVDTSHFAIGVIGGVSLVGYQTDMFPILWPLIDVDAENGSGRDVWGGVRLDHWLDSSHQHTLLLELLFDPKSGDFATISTARRGHGSSSDFVTDTIINGWMSARLSYWTIYLGYKYNFDSHPTPAGFGIELGPVLGLLGSGAFTRTSQRQVLNGNVENPIFIQETTTSEIPEFARIRLAFFVSLSYDIPLANQVYTTILVRTDYPVTKVNEDYNWIARSLFAGLAVHYLIHS